MRSTSFTKPSPVILLLASATASFVLLAAREAEALWRLQHAGFCWQDDKDTPSASGGFAILAGSNGSVRNMSTSFYNNVYCPVLDDSYFDANMSATLRVYGYDGNTTTSVLVWACSTMWEQEGGACGLSAGTSASWTGNYTLTPSVTRWDDPSDFLYVRVQLPPQQGSSLSTLRGFYLEKP
jgi:hypothetical protein